MEDVYAELRADLRKLVKDNEDVSYGSLAGHLGMSKGALHKFCNDPTYFPKSDEIKAALGISVNPRGELIVQVAVRADDGTFAKR